MRPIQLDSVFLALSAPTRREILARLAMGEATVGELARPFSISAPAISRHLRVLEQARLIEREKRGQQRICRLAPEHLQDAWQWLSHYRRFWEDRFARLDAYLASEPAERTSEDRES